MFRPIWATGASVLDFLPSNLHIRATHRRAGLKWGVPAMLVAGVYLVIAAGSSGGSQRVCPGG